MCLSKFKRDYQTALKKNEPQASGEKHSINWMESVALAELFEYVEQTLKENQNVILPLAELHSLYTNRIMELCGVHVSINKTRLKEKVAGHFPQLQESKSGRNVIFSRDAVEYKNVIDDWDTEARAFIKVTNTVRKHLFDNNSSGDQESSVPQKLLTLVTMLLEGSNLYSTDNDLSQAALTIAQLIKFNGVRRYLFKSNSFGYRYQAKRKKISARMGNRNRSDVVLDRRHLLCVTFQAVFMLNVDRSN